jgi:putative DNA primase/helicase
MFYTLVKKSTKLPIDYRTMSAGSSTDPLTWSDYNTIKFAADTAGVDYGIGLVLTDNDPYFCLDIDKAYDGVKWSDLATTLTGMFPGAYVEVSQSGKGLHVIGKYTHIDDHKCKNVSLGIELYHTGRFIILTGTHANGSMDHDCTDLLPGLINTYFEPGNTAQVVKLDTLKDEPTLPGYTFKGSDDDLIEKMRKSNNQAGAVFGDKASFSDLWDCNVEKLAKAFPSSSGGDFDRSSADQSLVNTLAFWTGANPARMDRLYRMSGLMRDKWDTRPDYVQATIGNSIASCQSCFSQQVELTGDMGHGADIGAGWSYFHVGFTETKTNGKPLGTLVNFKHLVNKAGISCKYNIMSKEVEITIPGAEFTTDNAKNNALAVLTSLANQVEFPVSEIERYAGVVADQNAYHPALNWIKSKPWDGVDRIDALVTTLDTGDSFQTTKMLVVKWLATAVRALIRPDGISASGVLVLQGDQNLGKTRWLKNLSGGFSKEGAILNPSDRDSVKQCVSHWLVELGELDATFRRSDIAALKAFITKDVDEFRLPYARAESKFPRKTVFFASVNPREYLHDDTGNRRFWTIEVGQNMIADHGLDAQQIWAQMLTMEKDVTTWLTRDELVMLEDINSDFQHVTTDEDLLRINYDLNAPRTRMLTVAEILQEIGVDPSHSMSRKFGPIVQKVFGKKARRSNGRRVYDMPEKLLPFQQQRAI